MSFQMFLRWALTINFTFVGKSSHDIDDRLRHAKATSADFPCFVAAAKILMWKKMNSVYMSDVLKKCYEKISSLEQDAR